MILAGNGRPIVLVHGVGDSAYGWHDLIVALNDDYRVIAVDQRGHGLAPRFSDLADPFSQLVEDLIGVLEAHGPAVVVGHSMGGAVAAEAAVARPDLFVGLVLEDPAWVDRHPAESALIGEARVAAKDKDLADLPAAIAAKIAAGWSAPEAHAWGIAHYQTQREFLLTGVVSSPRPWKQIEADIRVSRVPAVVFAGDGDGVVVDKQKLDLECVVFPGAGHCVRRERPAEFLEQLLARLKSWYGNSDSSRRGGRC